MSAVIDTPRPGLRAWRTLVRSEMKMVRRDTAGLIVPIGLPLLIMVMSAAGASEAVEGSELTGLEVYVLPVVFGVVLAFIGVLNMPSFLAYYRRSGILRRLAVTPASPVMVLIAQAIVSLLQAIVGISVAFAVAVLAFGARLPADLGAAIGVLGLGMAAMYGIGMIVAALAPTPNSAVAIGLVSFFALGALGGMFGGRQALPEALATAGEYLPFGATGEALSAAWLGNALDPIHLVSLAGTVLVGGSIAALAFRWD